MKKKLWQFYKFQKWQNLQETREETEKNVATEQALKGSLSLLLSLSLAHAHMYRLRAVSPHFMSKQPQDTLPSQLHCLEAAVHEVTLVSA